MSAFRAALIVLVVSSAGHARVAVKLWATDRACPALNRAVAEIGKVPFPEGWTIVVACTKMQWVTLQRKADAQDTETAFTNVKGRITVVRGRIFLLDKVDRPVHRVLLHEIGHIRCNCGDEAQAERWALDYERGK